MFIQRNVINADTPELILTVFSVLARMRCVTLEKNLLEIKEIRKRSIYLGNILELVGNT